MTEKLAPTPFLDLVKDASERLTGLLADIQRGLIDVSDIPQAYEDDLAAWCEDICATHRALLREISDKQAEEYYARLRREDQADQWAEFRHSQHERL